MKRPLPQIMVSQIQKKVNRFIYKNRPESSFLKFEGEVSKSHCVLWSTVVGSFWPLTVGLANSLFILSNPFILIHPFTSPDKALQGLKTTKTTQTTKTQSIWRPCVVFTKFWSVNKFWAGLLKYHLSIFILRRTAFDFFFFLTKNHHKTEPSFHCFEENELGLSDLDWTCGKSASPNFKKPANDLGGQSQNQSQNSM